MELATVVVPVTVLLCPTTKHPHALAICGGENPARFAGAFKLRPPILPGTTSVVAGAVPLLLSLGLLLGVSLGLPLGLSLELPLGLSLGLPHPVSAVTTTTTSLAATKVIVGRIIVVLVTVVSADSTVVVCCANLD